jgi:diguanylate cyclase (GGDEF)-like protein
LSISTERPAYFGLHTNPACRARSEAAARLALSIPESVPVLAVEDEDGYDDATGPAPIVLPILFGKTAIGKVALAPRDPAHAQDHRLVDVIARELGGPLRMAMLVEESGRLATIDALTGLKNRRAFIEAFALELAHCERFGYSVAVLLMDVDHFKAINDRFGHGTGDVVLAAVGKALRDEFRKVDVVARWGGEEFVVALSGASAEGVRIAAERVRQVIASLRVERPAEGLERDPVQMTVSIGVATRHAGESMDSVVDRADRAMYAAKTMGRNRVVVDTESAAPAVSEPPDVASELESGRWKVAAP